MPVFSLTKRAGSSDLEISTFPRLSGIVKGKWKHLSTKLAGTAGIFVEAVARPQPILCATEDPVCAHFLLSTSPL
jgi:hypothetical protein